jgi:hypothetical protein
MANNTYLPPCYVIPNWLTIAAVTRSYPMIVTVVESNLYIAGQSFHFSVPSSYGMTQLDQRTATIMQVNGLDFYMALDSTGFDPFVIPSSGEEPATVAPAGSNNLQYDNTTNRVPFQNLNGNIGN